MTKITKKDHFLRFTKKDQFWQKITKKDHTLLQDRPKKIDHSNGNRTIYVLWCNSIFHHFIHSFSQTWRGAGNKKDSHRRMKRTKVEDHGWVSVAVYFSNSRVEVWIFFFCRERRAQVIWLTMGTATAGVFGPKAHS